MRRVWLTLALIVTAALDVLAFSLWTGASLHEGECHEWQCSDLMSETGPVAFVVFLILTIAVYGTVAVNWPRD